MARKFNYTGRQKIRQEHVKLEITRVSEGLAYDADLQLSTYDLPSDAQVWVEAYRKASRMHFPFGTMEALEAPQDRLLKEFDNADGIQFRVRVTAVGDGHGMLLAVADRIKPSSTPDSDTYTSSLLGLTTDDLHGRIWALDFEDALPNLVLDKSIEDRHVVAGSDAFAALVLPAAFEGVLREILIINPDSWEEDDQSAWQNKWLDFAQRMPGTGELPGSANNNQEEVVEWIEDCTSAFAREIDAKRHFGLMRGEETA